MTVTLIRDASYKGVEKGQSPFFQNYKEGYNIEGTKILFQDLQNILTLPATVVHFEHGKPYVLIKNDSEKPTKHFITIGVSDGMNIQVLNGLKLGDRVTQD